MKATSNMIDRFGVARGESLVDQVPKRNRQREHCGGRHQQREERRHQHAAVWTQYGNSARSGASDFALGRSARTASVIAA
jgi:hypothetical protein